MAAEGGAERRLAQRRGRADASIARSGLYGLALHSSELNDPDEAAAQRIMSAMLQMTKIDIAELERAYAAGA